MPDFLIILSILAGFAFIVVVGAKIGDGSIDALSGMFRFEQMPPRPRGVQESDLPPFVFRDSKDFSSGAA